MISKEKPLRAIMLSMDNFGSWLLQELERKGISQSELSRLAGLSRGTLSNIISGTRGRGPDSIEAIARALKFPPETVFRAAGLLPPKPNADPWVEEMNHKLTLLHPSLRAVAGKLIDSLIEDDRPATRTKPKTKPAKS